MKIYISVVSHNHEKMIKDLGTIESLCVLHKVIIKSNTGNDNFSVFKKYKNFHWLDDDYNIGFGENNNVVFNYCINHLGMNDDDFFCVLNPDVLIGWKELDALKVLMLEDDVKLSTINLYRDYEKLKFDFSIRKFPKLSDFILSFFMGINKTIYDKSLIKKKLDIDWAAGSFMMFSAKHYRNLRGFDEKYFMYCEDIDICFRSALIGSRVIYYPQIEAIHLGKFENRRILSKHLYWHIKSVIRFLLKKKGKIQTNGV